MMPSSPKRGRGRERVLHRPIQFHSRWLKFHSAITERQLSDPLLVKDGGKPGRSRTTRGLFAGLWRTRAGVDEERNRTIPIVWTT